MVLAINLTSLKLSNNIWILRLELELYLSGKLQTHDTFISLTVGKIGISESVCNYGSNYINVCEFLFDTQISLKKYVF